MWRISTILSGIFVGSFVVTFGYLAHGQQVTVVTPTREPAQTMGATQTKAEDTLTATLLFVGDMMFDRTIRKDLEKGGDELIFSTVAPLLAETDMVVGNLEGPITTNASRSLHTKPGDADNTRFTFDPRVAGILARYGFGVVALGNNHIADFGKEGIAETKTYLDTAHVAHVGDPFATTTDLVLKEVRGITVGFVAYDQFILPDAAGARAALGRAHELGADFVVVLAHWGNEYESAPPDSVRALAASFVAAGADLIIGTHSHVIGEVEDIGAARVYYSLGNFIFDQYWEEQVRCGLVVKATLTKNAAHATAEYESRHAHLEPSGATSLDCRDIIE